MPYLSFLTHLVKALPSSCIFCQKTVTTLLPACSSCLNELPILSQSCGRCGEYLPESKPACGNCLITPPPYEATYALFRYQPPIKKLITKLKFQGELSYAYFLGELLAQKMATTYQNAKPHYLIPIPLATARLKERGFNQALEIAKPISKNLNIPIYQRGITRIKSTFAQSSLKKNKRQENVQSAFAITTSFEQKWIVVIDDVITTGFTMSSFCQLLKLKGAQKIDVWCAARCAVAET